MPSQGDKKIEVAEFLRQPHRRIDHALELVVVAHLDKAGQREILAQRMAVEAVIGQQPPHVRMAGEHDAVEIVGFALEPVGAGKHLDDRSDRRRLVGLDFHPDAHIVLGRKQMIDDVEAPFAARPVDRGHVDDIPEQAARIVAQEAHHRNDVAPPRAATVSS